MLCRHYWTVPWGIICEENPDTAIRALYTKHIRKIRGCLVVSDISYFKDPRTGRTGVQVRMEYCSVDTEDGLGSPVPRYIG